MLDMNGKEIGIGDRVFYRGTSESPSKDTSHPVLSYGSSTTLIVEAPGRKYTGQVKGVPQYAVGPKMSHVILASLCELAP